MKKSLIEVLRQIFAVGTEQHPTIDRRSEASSLSPRSRTQQTTITTPSPPARPAIEEGNPRAAQVTNDLRIKWGAPVSTHPSSPANPKLGHNGNSRRIDWGGSTGNVLENPGVLIGVEDAFEHTPILAGEQIAFCTHDKVAYHLSTWEFLRVQNRGCCCICGKSDVIKLIRLPGTLAPAPQVLVPRPTVPILPGENVIGLEDVPQFVGLAVMVQDFVHEVYRTRSTGTYFVRFEPRGRTDPVFAGFKLVIRPRYQSEWLNQGIRIEDYAGHYIRVRGIVQVHETWGIEILVNSPRVVEVVEGPKSEKDPVRTAIQNPSE